MFLCLKNKFTPTLDKEPKEEMLSAVEDSISFWEESDYFSGVSGFFGHSAKQRAG